jgi:hypothetical protein
MRRAEHTVSDTPKISLIPASSGTPSSSPTRHILLGHDPSVKPRVRAMWETPTKLIGNVATPERHRITPHGGFRRRHEVDSGDEAKLS